METNNIYFKSSKIKEEKLFKIKEENKVRQKKQKIAIAGIAVLALVGGTLAYFSANLKAVNELDTGDFSTEIVEEFTPDPDWEKGVEVKKKVSVANTGDKGVIARLTWNEYWTRKGETVPYETIKLVEDGLLNGSAVNKNLVNQGSPHWVYGGDGYYYYLTEIAGGSNSLDWMESITLDDNADLGTYENVQYYTSNPDQPDLDKMSDNPLDDPKDFWVKFEGSVPEDARFVRSITRLVDGEEGYSSSTYQLEIVVQVLQATKEAVDATWDLTTITDSDVTTFLNGIN